MTSKLKTLIEKLSESSEDRGLRDMVDIALDQMTDQQAKLAKHQEIDEKLRARIERLNEELARDQDALEDNAREQEEIEEYAAEWAISGRDNEGASIDFTLHVTHAYFSISDSNPHTMYGRGLRNNSGDNPRDILKALKGYTDLSWDRTK
jgi:hypothetical protein